MSLYNLFSFIYRAKTFEELYVKFPALPKITSVAQNSTKKKKKTVSIHFPANMGP